MSDNIYKNLNLPKFFPEHIKVCFFQACDWNKHSLKFKLHRKNKAISKKEALVDFEAFKFAIDNLYCGKPIHEKSGVDFEESYKLIEDYINSTERITTKDLCACGAVMNGIREEKRNLRCLNGYRFYCSHRRNPVGPLWGI